MCHELALEIAWLFKYFLYNPRQALYHLSHAPCLILPLACFSDTVFHFALVCLYPQCFDMDSQFLWILVINLIIFIY
jgi:hypothetical protein